MSVYDRSAGRRVHVCLIPSEEFVPPDNHLAGIFQLHQAIVLKQAGLDVGAISIRLAHSVPMIARAALLRLAGRQAGNQLDTWNVADMGALLFGKTFRPERYVRVLERAGIKTVEIDGFFGIPPSPRTNHLGWIRAGKTAFRRYVQVFGLPNVLHAHNLNPGGLLARQLSRAHGIPYVVTEHSSYYHRKLIPRGLYPALRRAASDCAGLAVVSPALASALERELSIDHGIAQVIPNVIDAAAANTPPPDVGRSDSLFRLLAIGNLIPLKGHKMLLRAFTSAFGDDDSATLIVGGDGPMLDELRRTATSLGIDGRVSFLGRLTREQVIREIDWCDSLVLTSEYETFGVVLIESLVRGKPVVSTACGGPESVVRADDGILVPVGDESALAAALVQMRTIHSRFDPAQLRAGATARFGEAAIAARLKQFYADALASVRA